MTFFKSVFIHDIRHWLNCSCVSTSLQKYYSKRFRKIHFKPSKSSTTHNSYWSILLNPKKSNCELIKTGLTLHYIVPWHVIVRQLQRTYSSSRHNPQLPEWQKSLAPVVLSAGEADIWTLPRLLCYYPHSMNKDMEKCSAISQAIYIHQHYANYDKSKTSLEIH